MSHDILHRIGVGTDDPTAVHTALTTLDGLTGWWTTDTTGDPGPGGVIAFRFALGGFDMEVTDVVPGETVRWTVVDGPPEWVGTTVEFDLTHDAGQTVVRFAHRGWVEPVEFMHHCSTKWASYLLSLKQLVESGSGRPHPHDLRLTLDAD